MEETLTVGCSTGVLYTTGIPLPEVIGLLHDLALPALEMDQSILPLAQHDDATIPWDVLHHFSYVSVHAPAAPFGDNAETADVFAAIRAIAERCTVRHVVVHPDTVEDFSVFERDLGFRVAFENMDVNKRAFTTPQEMRTLLDRFPNAGMVLDVNHVYTHDPTMALAREFYELCGERIIAVHVSGYETLHDPLFKTKQVEIIEAIQDRSVPLIIESQVGRDEVAQEVAFVTDTVCKRQSGAQ